MGRREEEQRIWEGTEDGRKEEEGGREGQKGNRYLAPRAMRKETQSRRNNVRNEF